MNTRTADDGVAEVIGFLLIIAVIVAFAGVWILIYLPSEGNMVETDHARLVTEQFADLKYGINLLWITGREGVTSSRLISPSPVEGTTISGLLFLSPPVGTGTITLGKGTNFKINNNLVTALKITYNSANYYASDIRLVYDGGAIFRNDEGEAQSVFLDPSLGTDRLVLVTVNNDNEQQVLGNIPLSVTYSYVDTIYYDNADVTLVSADSDNPWHDFLPQTFANVTVVEYEASIGGWS